MKYIIAGILIISVISCNNKQLSNDLERPFIVSYSELTEEGIDVLSEILDPYELENDTLTIDKAFRLDVKFDSTLYSKEDLRYNYFIGLKLKPDLYDLIVFNIDLRYGAIATCEMLTDESLIINNYEYLFTNLSSLKKCERLNIPDSLLRYTENNKTMFRHLAWTNRLYGAWQLDTSNKSGFVSDQFNNSWIFEPEKGFLLLGSEKNIILEDSIELQGNILRLVESGHEFELATQTKRKILLKEIGTEEYKFLIKTR